MCLIVTKLKGVAFPTPEKMSLWFNRYHDGMGISFQWQGQVRTIKGAMSIAEMNELVQKVADAIYPLHATEVGMIIQFRQAFTGKPCARFAHPFPVSKKQRDLDSLDVVSKYALGHNGVLWNYNKKVQNAPTATVNDAQEFIKEILAPLQSKLHTSALQKLWAEVYDDSRFALISNSMIWHLGYFYEEGGLYFSNFDYKDKPYVTYYPTTKSIVTEYHKGGFACELCGATKFITYKHDGQNLCWDCHKVYEDVWDEADEEDEWDDMYTTKLRYRKNNNVSTCELCGESLNHVCVYWNGLKLCLKCELEIKKLNKVEQDTIKGWTAEERKNRMAAGLNKIPADAP